MMRLFTTMAAILVVATVSLTPSLAQTQQLPKADRHSTIGDSPDIEVPLARDLSAKLTTGAIDRAMKKVADWQMSRSQDDLNTDWTFAVLEAGLVAASDTLNDPSYRDAVAAMGAKRGWTLGRRLTHADDQVVAQSYLEICEHDHKAEQITPLKQQFDTLKVMPDDPQKPVWWWCDALFMAPPAWAGLSRLTGDRSYLDYMDRQWWITSNRLFDTQEHLFFRDANFLHRQEANGKKVFWLRGNGWVLGGLARVLTNMPADYPSRSKYVQMFNDMSSRLATLQGQDGLWRAGLLDQAAYPSSETSGSALVTYALAWGVNNGILKTSVYVPVIRKAWSGLLSRIYQDGRLGYIQPVGDRPAAFRPTSSYVYGVGAFLLAGSELHKMAARAPRSANAAEKTSLRGNRKP